VLGPGAQIAGRFTLLRKVGSGGFGEVWLANDGSSGAEVAIKVLRTDLTADERLRARFVREGRLLAALEHPGIPRAIACEATPELAYLALEYVRGRTLQRVLIEHSAQRALLPLQSVQAILDSLAAAIDFAHSRQVVHRDLKPHNVMCVGHGSLVRAVKVLDFGIAKLIGDDPNPNTTRGRVLGSVPYMSPERLQRSAFDHRSDLFNLAIVLFEMLTARRAWILDARGEPAAVTDHFAPRSPDNVPLKIFARILKGDRPLPSRYRTELLTAVDEIVLRGLDPEPSGRFESALEMARELRAALLPLLPDTENEETMRLGLGHPSLTDFSVAISYDTIDTDPEPEPFGPSQDLSESLPLVLGVGSSDSGSDTPSPRPPASRSASRSASPAGAPAPPTARKSIRVPRAKERPPARAMRIAVLLAALLASGLIGWVLAGVLAQPSRAAREGGPAFEAPPPAERR
jgi:serine/threonine-protein kinase